MVNIQQITMKLGEHSHASTFASSITSTNIVAQTFVKLKIRIYKLSHCLIFFNSSSVCRKVHKIDKLTKV